MLEPNNSASIEALSISNLQRKLLPGPSLLHNLVQGCSTEENAAIDYLDNNGSQTCIEYGLLHRLTDKLAQIIQLKVGATTKQPIIPVVIPQTPELYVSWIAVLKAGAAFCPITTDTPVERLRFILEDVSAHLVLCAPGAEDLLRQTGAKIDILAISIVHLHQVLNDEAICSASVEGRNASRDNALAYVMYTSGSTGQPKGVKISHHSAIQSLLAHHELIPSFERFLQFAAPTFDISVFEVFFTLFRGATLVCCDRERLLSDLPRVLTYMNVDAAELTPTVAGTLLRTRVAAPCLKTLLTIGEMLNEAVVEEFGGSDKHESMLYAMYGPTEASMHCTAAPRLEATSSVTNIGRPLSTVTAFVLNDTSDKSEAGHSVMPIGQIGELAVAGQLASGYLNRPDQTAAAFIDLPPYGPVYRTGDRAKMLLSGELEILGRISAGQVKVRGQRLELGEIERVLCKTPDVQWAVVSIVSEVIVAFCATGRGRVTPEDIHETCRRWLPQFMRPGDIVLLQHEIPRLPSGKIDRRQLEVDYRQGLRQINPVPDEFQDQLGQKLATSVALELHASVSAGTNLWSAGLNSLHAIKIASALRECLPQITVRDILSSDTLRDLATNLRKKDPPINESILQPADDPAWEKIKAQSSAKLRHQRSSAIVEGLERCTSMQIAMLGETTQNGRLNFNRISLQLVRNVPERDIRDAFLALAKQNDILRSGFMHIDNDSHPFVRVVWKELDCETELDLLHPLKLEFTHQQPAHVLVHIHHALYDGWSWDLVMADLNLILNGKVTPERPQFRVFEQHARQKTFASDESHDYWQEMLADVELTPFPTLQTRFSSYGSKSRCNQQLSVPIEHINAFCQRNHISYQAVVCAAWLLYLDSYIGTSSVITGLVTSGRTRPISGVDKIIGPFLCTFPLRANVTDVRTCQELCAYVHRLQQELLTFEGLSLREIKKICGRSANEKLFDTLFIWQGGYQTLSDQSEPLKCVLTEDQLDYAIALEAESRDGFIHLQMTHDLSLLSHDHAVLCLKQLNEVFCQFVQKPSMALADVWQDCSLPLLSVSNTDHSSFGNSFTLTSTIERLASEDPDRVAVSFVQKFDPNTKQSDIQSISYCELWWRAKKLAHYLNAKYQVCPDANVCLILPKSVDLYLTILAIIISGAGYTCVDPRTPPNRLRQILQEASCQLVICDVNSDCETVDATGTTAITLGDLKAASINSGVGHPVLVTGSHLAYTVFTSGSTGIPKGVQITRNNLLSNLDVLSKVYPTSSGDSLLQACSAAFDVSVFEIFWTWHMGMTLYTATNNVLFHDLEGFISAFDITHLSMTPSVAALISPENVPSVKCLITAGEPMNSKVFEEWSDRCLYQGYGPSETTNICNLRSAVKSSDFASNVGLPFPNTSIFICDRGNSQLPLRLLPIGAVGEIWIGGDQVGRGYLDPFLTKKSFFEHPQYGRLYRSGDIGRLLVDGSLVILGREDDQVKIRGQRIELGDINASLVRVHYVKDAVTLIPNEGVAAHKVVAFWVRNREPTSPSSQEDNASLYRHLESHLPSYMLPDMLVPLQSLPLSSQGKIDRSKLIHYLDGINSETYQTLFRYVNSSTNVALSSQDEKQAAEALASVIGCPLKSIKRGTSFFSLGIDSISSIRFARALRERHFPAVDVSTIMRHSSIDRLMSAIGRRQSQQSFTNEASRSRIYTLFDQSWIQQIHHKYRSLELVVEKVLPCTPQQGSMLAGAVEQKSAAYQNLLRFEIRGDIQRLKLSWVVLLKRHQILRTAFVMTPNGHHPFAQIVLEDFELPFSKVDDVVPTNEILDPLNLPPYRLIMRKGHRHFPSELEFRIHHALYDAEAMGMLLREIEEVYYERSLPLAPLFDAYLEYMVNLEAQTLKEFWTKRLAGYRPFLLSPALTVKSQMRASAGQVRSQFSASLSWNSLQKVARGSFTTPLVWVQAAWARLLSSYAGFDDVCFGNVFSGRNLPITNVDQIVGPCFNTLPIRVAVDDRISNQDLAKALFMSNQEILPFQPSSLRMIQKLLNRHGAPFFDTLVLMQHEESPLDSSIWTLRSEEGDMDFPFILEILPQSQTSGLDVRFHHDLDITVGDHVLRNFEALLQHTVQYPHARSTDFSVLDSQVLQMSLPQKRENVNGAILEFPPSETMWSKIEVQIRQIFADLSEVDAAKISKDTSIFTLGLDSINAIQIASQLRKAGFDILGFDVLEARTVEKLSMVCQNRQGFIPAKPLIDLDLFDRDYRHRVCESLGIEWKTVQSFRPCTTLQAGILAQCIRSEGNLYMNSITLEVSSDVDLDGLKDAWIRVVERHEMLRTGFASIEEKDYPFVMITYATGTHALPWYDSNEHRCDHGYGRTRVRTGLLQQLHHPPWKLLVSCEDDRISIEIMILHALYDGQSLDQILADVANVYHQRPITPSSPINIALRNILDRSSGTDESRRFWVDSLAGSELTKFPDLRIYQGNGKLSLVSLRTCSVEMKLLHKPLRDLGISLQTALLCAWSRLLAAYTAQTTVTFGVILSSRNHDDLDGHRAVFPCINTLPFFVDTSRPSTDIFNWIADTSAGLVKHQFIPFNTIKKWLKVDSDLFDSVIVLQKFTSRQPEDVPWRVISDEANVEYALSMEIIPTQEGLLDFKLTYSDDLIPPEQADIILAQYDAIFLEILGQNGSIAPIPGALASIVPAKDDRINTEVATLHGLVETMTESIPDKTALEFATSISKGVPILSKWTYSELECKSNQIAHLLIDHGLLPGDLVAICFDKCPEASFAILGVLKAGCAYVAIDPGAPSARKDFILKDAKCKALLTRQDDYGDISQSSAQDLHVLFLDLPELTIDFLSCRPTLSRAVTSADTCYCLYTSGTTGTPKGCLISHDSAIQAMLSFQRIFANHWNEDSRFLQFASFHFDVSVLEQYWSWSVGICVTSAPRNVLFEDLPTAIHALKITHMDLTPSLARLLTPEDVPSLCQGVFIVGGEQVRQDILDIWGDFGCLYNFYGPSEVTIGCTVHPRVPKNAKPTNIGQQWDNVGSFVLRPGSQEPVLRGAPGELCLSGPLVGKGYLNRNELTLEKFVLLEKSCTRVYRTGDLVRLLHDNSFEFIGRTDDQIKLRGQRLEIGEINHVVRGASNTVHDVASMVLRHPQHGKEQLVSFFTTRRHRANKGEALHVLATDDEVAAKVHQHCTERLPGYMVPTLIMQINFMPLSANNKIDMKALKPVFEEALSSTTSFPTSNVEEDASDPVTAKIFDVLSSFLAIPTTAIKTSSSLFELGLDSITIIAFSNALRRAGFPGMQSGIIMAQPTIASLVRAASLDRSRDEPNQVDIVRRQAEYYSAHSRHAAAQLDVAPASIESMAPCTGLQDGMIAQTMKEEHESRYFSTFKFKLFQSCDVQRLTAAWDTLREDLPILRTRFVDIGDGYAQVVISRSEEILASKIYPIFETRLERFRRLVKGFGKRPCWEVRIVPIAGGSKLQYHMVLDIFHGLYDEISFRSLLDKLRRIYHDDYGTISGSPSFHTAVWKSLSSQPGDSERYWRDSLRRKGLLNIPTLFPDATPTVGSTFQWSIGWMREVSSPPFGGTWAAIFQAAWILSLEDNFHVLPTVGVVMTGRYLAVDDAMDIIGPLFNTLPLGLGDLPGSRLIDLVQACDSFNRRTEYQHNSLSDISKWTGLAQPLFNNVFVYSRPDGSTGDGNSSLWELISTESAPVCPLSIEVAHTAGSGECVVTIVSQAQFLDEGWLKCLSRTFTDMLKRVINHSSDMLPRLVNRNPSRQNGSRELSENQSNDTHSSSLLQSRDRTRSPLSNSEAFLLSQIAAVGRIHVNDIRANHTIFELGLDSIDAVRLSSRLKARGLILSVRDILNSRNIQDMTEKTIVPINSEDEGFGDELTKSRKQHHGLDKGSQFAQMHTIAAYHFADEHEDLEQLLPVTPMQEAILAEYPKYYNFFTLKLRPNIDISRLLEAFKNTVERYTILRTQFFSIDSPALDGSFMQVVNSRCNPSISANNAELKPTRDIESEVARKRKQVGSRQLECVSFDVTFFKDGEEATVLLGMSHAIYDAWSLELLHQEICRAYQGIPPMAQNATHQNISEILGGDAAGAEIFWKHQLSSVRSSLLPRNNPSSLQKEVCLAHIMSKTKAPALRNFSKVMGVTLQSIGLVCWSLVLSHHLRQSQVCFGVVLSGRTSEDADRLMFPTFNTVIANFDILHKTTIRENLQSMHQKMLQISDYQHYPLRKALGLTSVEGELFSSLFVFQKSIENDEDVERIYDIDDSMRGEIDPAYPVNLEMEVKGDRMVWTGVCNGYVMNEEALNELVGCVDEVLTYVVDHPDSPVVAWTDEKDEGYVSVCGLPSIKIDEETGTSATKHGSGGEKIVAAIDDKLNMNSDIESVATVLEGWSKIERTIRRVLAEVAKVEESIIKKTTNVFYLGLDSISAIKVSSVLKKQGILLPVGRIMKTLTVERMAAVAEQNQKERKDAAGDVSETSSGPGSSGEITSPITNITIFDTDELLDHLKSVANLERKDIEAIIPATAAQLYTLGMWQASDKRLFYPIFRFMIRGADTNAISEKWRQLRGELAILRTGFVQLGEGGLCQVVMRKTAGDEARASSHYQLLWKDVTEAEGSQTMEMMLKIHHALYDAVSLRSIIDALRDSCAGNETDVIGDVASIVQVQQCLQSSATTEERSSFWRRYLAPLGKAKSPISEIPESHYNFDGKRFETYRDDFIDNLSGLKAIAAQAGVSIQAILFAAVARVYVAIGSNPSDYTVIGVYLANRSLGVEEIDLERLAFPTFNVVPLKVNVAANLIHSAKQVQNDLAEIGSDQNCGVSMQEIWDWTGVKVECVVNFLSLPECDVEDQAGCEDKTAGVQTVKMQQDQNTRSDSRAASPFLDDTRVELKWVVPTVDVEAKVMGDGLGVGVFAPQSRAICGESLFGELEWVLGGLVRESLLEQ